jgi:hypothetical protein
MGVEKDMEYKFKFVLLNFITQWIAHDHLVHRQTIFDMLIDDQVCRMVITKAQNLFDHVPVNRA